jgi:hypothetical protein
MKSRCKWLNLRYHHTNGKFSGDKNLAIPALEKVYSFISQKHEGLTCKNSKILISKSLIKIKLPFHLCSRALDSVPPLHSHILKINIKLIFEMFPIVV